MDPSWVPHYSWWLGLNIFLFVPISLLIFAMPFIPTKYRTTPTKSTAANNANALKQGVPILVVRFMMAYQHLTVCTMTATAIYFVFSASAYHSGRAANGFICTLRIILPGAGAVVAQFWTFVFTFGPWSLVPREDFPADNNKAKWLTERMLMRPSWTRHCIFYVLMHVQHTWMPLLPWLELGLYGSSTPQGSCPVPSMAEECWMVTCYLLTWLVWGLLVWKARKNPPYPILRVAWQGGTWPVLYGSMCVLGLGAAVVSNRMRHRGAFLVSW